MHILINDEFDYPAERLLNGIRVRGDIDPSIAVGASVRIIEPALFEDRRSRLRIATLQRPFGDGHEATVIGLETVREG